MESYSAPVALQMDTSAITMTANKSINLKIMGTKMLLSNGKYLESLVPQWLLNFGCQGVLSNGIYTAPTSATTEQLIAYYTLNGLTKRAVLTIAVENDGTSINLSPNKISVPAGTTYDLKTIKATIEYVDGMQMAITPSWRILSGGGTILNGVYTAPQGAAETVLEAYHASVSETSNARLYINKTEESNAMNITSNDFTYSTDIYPFVGKKFDLSVAVSNGSVKCSKEFKMIIFDTSNFEISEIASAFVGSSITITPSVTATTLTINVVGQNGGKMNVTINNLVSAIAA